MSPVDSQRDSRQRRSGAGSEGNVVSRLFASLALFISQILDELRKVVRPTRSELWNYTLVVIVFVGVIMFFIAGIDWVFSRAVMWVFGGGS